MLLKFLFIFCNIFSIGISELSAHSYHDVVPYTPCEDEDIKYIHNKLKYSGKGSLIGVVDSGLYKRHIGIKKSYVDGKSFVDDSWNDNYWHGTAVSGVIAANYKADGYIYKGIAYGAKILPIKIFNDRTDNDKFDQHLDADRFMSYAIKNKVDILNVSMAIMAPNFYKMVRSVTNNGIAIVASAGNHGESQPVTPAGFASDKSMNGMIISVVSLDNNGDLSKFDKSAGESSNQCGATKDFCIGARGDNVLSLSNKNNKAFLYASGTSFAAPQVSGALAIMKEAHPKAKMKDLIKILLNTARNPKGSEVNKVISDKWGHGLMDLKKALSPYGKTFLPASSGDHVEIQRGQAIGSILGGLANNKSLDNIMILDEYSRDFYIDMHDYISPNVSTNQALVKFNENVHDVELNDNVSVKQGMISDTASVSFANVSLPYLSNNSNHGAFSTKLLNNSLMISSSLDQNQELAMHTYEMDNKLLSMNISHGIMKEKNHILGNKLQGMFSISDAQSYFLHYGLSHKVADNSQIDAYVDLASTVVEADKNSLFKRFSDIQSVAYGINASRSGNFLQSDKLILAFDVPMRIYDGDVTVEVPVSMLDDGVVIYNSRKLSLAGSNKYNISLSYSLSQDDLKFVAGVLGEFNNQAGADNYSINFDMMHKF